MLAFWLRVHDLAAQPLRGDEAFAVRYWAAPPGEVLSHLAWVEPHPFGTYLGFWAWRSLVGEGEFAMRLLPGLLNLVGAAGVFALARRLWRADGHARLSLLAALVAVFLWAINPGLIWHSQDMRNYAPWAGLSVVSLWLLARAIERRRPRDWALYVVVETLTLYVFFLEVFMLIAHALYAVIRTQPRSTSHSSARHPSWLIASAFLAIAVLLIPWCYQAYRLAGSGYGGTAAHSDLGVLLTTFIPGLLFGEPALSSLGAALPGAFITGLLLTFVIAWALLSRGSRAARLSLIVLFVPPALLFLAGTRLDVFRPRYILAVTPAIILALAAGAALIAGLVIGRVGFPARRDWRRLLAPSAAVVGWLLLAITVIVSADALATYYGGGYRKAPDWRALAVYLAGVERDGVILLTAADSKGSVDPTFQYYYEGAFEVLPRAGVDMEAEIARLLRERGVVFLVDQPGANQAVHAALDAAAEREREASAGEFRITTYRHR